jgi:hypothetical protein
MFSFWSGVGIWLQTLEVMIVRFWEMVGYLVNRNFGPIGPIGPIVGCSGHCV